MGEGLKKTDKGWNYNGKLLSPAEQRFHDKIAALTPTQYTTCKSTQKYGRLVPKVERLLCTLVTIKWLIKAAQMNGDEWAKRENSDKQGE